MIELQAILTIAFRDFTKLLCDRPRLVVSFIFPVLFIGVLGGSLQSGFGDAAGFNLITFIFTGVLAQNLFQSTASGVISLIEDRENDFSQEIFVSPISRYSIILGKILGETMVAMVLGLGIIIFGFIVGVPLTFAILLKLIPVAFVACFFGGAFGVIVLSNLGSQRTANQIFPLIIFPQFILAGVFNPIGNLPWYLDILSRLSPMRYAVDLMRGVYYSGTSENSLVVQLDPTGNLLVIGVTFVIFLVIGTALFVKNERNR